MDSSSLAFCFDRKDLPASKLLMAVEPATLIVSMSKDQKCMYSSTFRIEVDIGGHTGPEPAVAIFPLDQVLGPVLQELTARPPGTRITQSFRGFAVGSRDSFVMPCCVVS